MATYRAVIDTSNKNNSHTLAIDFIVEDARAGLKILDAGCSEGYLGGYLQSLGHHVIGVEMNPIAANKAREVIGSVFTGSILEYLSHDVYQRFDVILFGDVLEHIANPQEVLEVCQSRLNDGGFIIVSLPNVAHSCIRAMLLGGRWDYSELGILDRTHLRFFTEEGAADLFSKTHFQIDGKKVVRLPTDVAAKMCDIQLHPKLVEIVHSQGIFTNESDIFQFVFKLTPPPSSAIRVVVISVPQQSESLLNFRLRFPLNNWASRYGGIVRYRTFDDVLFDDLYWGDVFVFQREVDQELLDLTSLLQGFGKLVVFEIDDFLLDLPKFLSHHNLNESRKMNLEKMLQQSNALSVTTSRLAKALQTFNQHIFVVPNCSWSLGEKVNFNRDESGAISLVIASSDSVQVDFLVPVLQKLKRTWGNHIQIHVIGPPADYFKLAGIELTSYAILRYEEFCSLLTSLNNPIGLIPLDPSLFSSCKSPIKFFDYAANGVPTIASKVPPYADSMIDYETGLLVDNETEEWVRAIESLIESPTLTFTLLENANKWMHENAHPNIAGDAWNSIFNSMDLVRNQNINLLNCKTYQGLVLKNLTDIEIKKKKSIFSKIRDFTVVSHSLTRTESQKIPEYLLSWIKLQQYTGRDLRGFMRDLNNLIYPLATDLNFEETCYLMANPDVYAAVQNGQIQSGWVHFDIFGRHEYRRMARR